MKIKGRQFAAVADDLRHAGEALEQRCKRIEHCEHDTPAAGADEFRIAAELQGVAQALFAVQQNGLAGERFATPAWFGMHKGRRRAAPAPFITFPAALEVPAAQAAQGKIELRRAVLGIALDGAFEGRAGLCPAAQSFEGDAAVVLRIGEPGRDTQSGLEAGQRLVAAVEGAQRGAAIVPRLGESRPQGDAGVEAGERVIELPQLMQHVAEIIACHRVGDIGRHQPVQQFRGARQATGLRINAGQQIGRFAVIRASVNDRLTKAFGNGPVTAFVGVHRTFEDFVHTPA